MQHALKTGLRKTGFIRCDKRSKKVINITNNSVFLSHREAAEYLGMQPVHLYRRLQGYTKNNTSMRFLVTIAEQALKDNG